MLRRANSATFYGVAAVCCLFALNLTQTEAATLRKMESRDGQKETSTSRFQEGFIVFGKGPNNNNTSGDAGSYQADYPASVLDSAQWNNMGSSLLCGPNFMKFGVSGSHLNHFDFGQNPAAYHVEKHPHGTSLYIPFKGCYIVYEDGTYNYPIKWHGVPLTLKCPKPTTTPAPHFPWSIFKPTTSAPITLPHFPHIIPPGWNPLPPTQTPSATIPLHYQTYFQYIYYLLHLLNEHTTSAPPQALYLKNVITYLLQLLHDHLSSTTPSPQYIIYLQQVINHLLQLLYDLYHAPASQVPDPQLPHIFQWYFQLLQHATSAPQNPLYGKLPLNPPFTSIEKAEQLNPSLLLSIINAQSAKVPPKPYNPYGHLPWNPPAQTGPHHLPWNPPAQTGPHHLPWNPPAQTGPHHLPWNPPAQTGPHHLPWNPPAQTGPHHLPWNPPAQTGPHHLPWNPKGSGQVHVLPKHQGTLQKS